MRNSIEHHINGKTKLVGHLAMPSCNSLYPRVYNLAFTLTDLNYSYLAFEVGNKELEDVVKGLKAAGVAGFNVSSPNKTKILDYLDEVDHSAENMGFSNTVVNRNGKLIGYNTEGIGYVKNLDERGVNLSSKKVTLVGSGGVATPIALQLAQSGIKEISIFGRDDSFWTQAEKNVNTINNEMQSYGVKANFFAFEDKASFRREVEESAVLANGTNIGMTPMEHQSIVDETPDILRPGLVVTDVVYAPQKTKLLQQAEQAGALPIDGISMLLWQGALAFKLFTGEDMPVTEITKFINTNK